MAQKFVRVPNDWFQEINGERTFASTLGVNNFTMWFALNIVSANMNMSNTIRCQIKEIEKEMSGIKGFSKTQYIRKSLLRLQEFGLIKSNNLTSKSKPMDLLNIELCELSYSNGFSCISTNLYEDKILKIQPNGLIIFCLLFKNHNTGFGDNTCNGHVEITRESISRFTGIKSVKTITDVINSIKRSKSLIRIEQHKIKSIDGETKYMPNRYQVLPKFDTMNKYYIDFKQSQT